MIRRSRLNFEMLTRCGRLNFDWHHIFRGVVLAFVLLVMPIILGCYVMKIWRYDISLPFYYDDTDAIWQLTLTKLLLDTGWVLTNPFMGAPSVAHWYNNPAAQASALHSVFLWIVGQFAPNAVAAQQCYYIYNFSLITVTSYISCRMIGIRTFFAVCIGFIFAFLPARFNLLAYAYLSNYFMIPLAVIPAVWILVGRFADQAGTGRPGGLLGPMRSIAMSKLFLLSLAIVVAMALTDGYYAFFTLLLLGVATMLRVMMGDIRRPLALAAPTALIIGVMATAWLLLEPLRIYQHTHPEEFAPYGVADPALQRYPFEAVVYSSSLMVLLAPSDQHRVPALARLGQYIMDASNQARVYPRSQWAPLGTLGSLLFIVMLACVATSLIRDRNMVRSSRGWVDLPPDALRLLGTITVLSLFVVGCSIFGGFGALVALIFPVIRAYDRFPIFLSFLLLCAAGVFLTYLLERHGRPARFAIYGVTSLVTVLAVVDQAPYDILHNSVSKNASFLSEQRFVRQMEAALPAGAMVYQDPYSNYLTDNRYYGWGSFADMRFYLHSRHLRWSSGASKNSPVDQWHEKIAELPTGQRLTEVEAVGFQAFLVDRTVVPDDEYNAIRSVLIARTGQPPMDDPASNLAFWKLPDPGYHLVYGADFINPERVVVTDPEKLATEPLSRVLRRDALTPLLATAAANKPLVIDRTAHPEIFRDNTILDRGLGVIPITSAPEMKGDVSCPADAGRQLSVSRDSLTLQIRNRSDFDWLLNRGPLPLRIGMMELLNAEGTRLRWDGGFRVPGVIHVGTGESIELNVPLAGLDLHTGVPEAEHQVTAVFALVQDGNAWFATAGNAVCRVTLTR
jgi:hypothetical protein